MKLSASILHRSWARAGFYLNLPELMRILAFRQRRRAFWSRYWQNAARHAGATCHPLERGYIRLERDGKACIVRDGEVPLDSHLMLDMMGDKAICNGLLSELGAPVVPHAVFSIDRTEIAARFLEQAQAPVVVKPASGTGGGRGVTTGISDLPALRRAARYAARYDDRLIVEREITGRSYRLLFLNGHFIDAILREPPVVVGDGRHSIRQLVRMENTGRLTDETFRALSPIQMNPDFRNTLRKQRLSPRTVPQQDSEVVIKGAINENAAARNHNVTDSVHPRTIALCASLVTSIGVEFAGVDILCDDIALPLCEQQGFVTEINTTPGLHHHLLVSPGSKVTPVDRILLDYMFSSGRGCMVLAAAEPEAAGKTAARGRMEEIRREEPESVS